MGSTPISAANFDRPCSTVAECIGLSHRRPKFDAPQGHRLGSDRAPIRHCPKDGTQRYERCRRGFESFQWYRAAWARRIRVAVRDQPGLQIRACGVRFLGDLPGWPTQCPPARACGSYPHRRGFDSLRCDPWERSSTGRAFPVTHSLAISSRPAHLGVGPLLQSGRGGFDSHGLDPLPRGRHWCGNRSHAPVLAGSIPATATRP